MTDEEFFDRAFAGSKVMGIFRGFTPERTVQLCNAAWDAGVPLVEVPVMSPAELPALVAAVAAGRDRGELVGAGTVTTAEQVDEVARAGAAFTVAPGFDAGVVAAGRRAGLPHIPGVATSTEITAAVAAGAIWLKAFPAAVLTPAWITAQRGPFPRVKFIATGGVTPDNASDFLDAGCSAVALGTVLSDEATISRLGPLLRAG
jgi:2-dehydro-3-deoxyphosphogluconate aldolase/(4S)-4-hydroxy-2-oxoglutarate aldolase